MRTTAPSSGYALYTTAERFCMQTASSMQIMHTSIHMDTAELCRQLAADSHRERLVEVFECRSRPAAGWAPPFSSAFTVVA